MHQASTRPAPPSNRNAPNPSTRLLPRTPQLEFFELKQSAQRPKPRPLCPPWPCLGLSFPRGLVLARPSAREDGTLENRNARVSLTFPLATRGKCQGTKETTKETTQVTVRTAL